MHTTNIDKFTFHHNGDFSGNVEIRRSSWDKSVWVPFAVLKEFVAEGIRRKKIEQLEEASADELLDVQK